MLSQENHREKELIKTMENRPVQFQIINDGWKILKKYLEADESGIPEFIEEIDRFYKKYDNPFAKEIALACVNEIDRALIEKNEKE